MLYLHSQLRFLASQRIGLCPMGLVSPLSSVRPVCPALLFRWSGASVPPGPVAPPVAAPLCSVWLSNSVQPQRRQPARLPHPWGSPSKNTGVGCYFLLQCMKVKSESEVTQSCLTCSDPMDCSPPGSSVHGIFQARVLEWGAIAFSYRHYRHFEKLLEDTC